MGAAWRGAYRLRVKEVEKLGLDVAIGRRVARRLSPAAIVFALQIAFERARRPLPPLIDNSKTRNLCHPLPRHSCRHTVVYVFVSKECGKGTRDVKASVVTRSLFKCSFRSRKRRSR
ncbi:hypothetical protein EVAR_93054_1 [Eumeta japonica]|uniref:Uncharacterized protein n=1 Tax=Eumeta variegata TaxID=151549 RepID=A0A4C1TF32_EUMVA|nr:hypothetical protein EVAR_93054_1 [Eumeta japonica]